MNVAMLNLASFGLLLVGVIVHIVCIALPNFAYGDLSDLATEMRKMDPNVDPNMEPVVDPNLASIEVDYGLFKMCVRVQTIQYCVTLGTKTTVASGTLQIPDSLETTDWQKACQALAIIGVLFAAGGLGLTGLSIFKESKGDRMRLLPLIICGLCWAGAVFCFIGNMVFAAKYTKFFPDVGPKVPEEVRMLTEKMFHLDWGFGLDVIACALFALGGGIHLMFARLGGQGTNGMV